MREAASFIAGQTSTASAGTLSALLRTIGNAFRLWNQRRHLRKLTELDDHLLADIGIRRDDVVWALDLPFSHEPMAELQRRAGRKRQRDWRG